MRIPFRERLRVFDRGLLETDLRRDSRGDVDVRDGSRRGLDGRLAGRRGRGVNLRRVLLAPRLNLLIGLLVDLARVRFYL